MRLFRFKRHKARIVLTNGARIETDKPILVVIHGAGGGGGTGRGPSAPIEPVDTSQERYVEVIHYF